MPLPDSGMIKDCIAGKASAQKSLYEYYAPKMLAVCNRYAQKTAEAEDILQDAFVKIFQNLHKYKETGSLEAWIRRVCVNTAIDHVRREKHRYKELEIKEAYSKEVSEDALDSLELEFLFKIIQALPSGYRLVFNMYAIEGYSHAEIGKKLNISESTSRSQYARARALLKQRISEAYMETNIYKDAI
ncbi:MAG: sigma-70 family RNA polymerase sigma factor [Bacteroidota bacterium]